MKPVICIINYDDNSIQLFNGDTLPIDYCILNDENSDELYIRDELHYAYFEDKDNSDDYDEDEYGYCEWIQIDLPNDNDIHEIIEYTSSDVADILKSFKFIHLITIIDGSATICE